MHFKTTNISEQSLKTFSNVFVLAVYQIGLWWRGWISLRVVCFAIQVRDITFTCSMCVDLVTSVGLSGEYWFVDCVATFVGSVLAVCVCMMHMFSEDQVVAVALIIWSIWKCRSARIWENVVYRLFSSFEVWLWVVAWVHIGSTGMSSA